MALVVVTIKARVSILYVVALIYDNDSPKATSEWTVCDGIAYFIV
jgi:hypothetical protein